MAHNNTHVTKGEGNDVHQGFDKDVHNYLCVLNCDLKYFCSHIKTLARGMIKGGSPCVTQVIRFSSQGNQGGEVQTGEHH